MGDPKKDMAVSKSPPGSVGEAGAGFRIPRTP